MAEYLNKSPKENSFDEWESKLDRETLESGSVNKSLNESSLVLDNGTLYGSSKNLGKRRFISSLEDSESIVKEDNRELIISINEKLKRNGFPAIKSSSHTVFLKLIDHLLKIIEEMTFGISFASLEDVFKRAFNRPFEKSSKLDSSVASLINVYEVQKRSYERDIERLAKELSIKKKSISQVEENMRQNYHKALSELQEKLVVLENRCSELKIDKKTGLEEDSQGIIEEVCKVLNIKQPNQIVPAVIKLEKVLRAVPSLEKLIKDVFFVVSSNDSSEEKLTMENLIPTLKRTFKELHEFKCKKKGSHSGKSAFYQEVIEHFKHLFEIEKDEDLIETMDQVFLFVHELRSFLKSMRVTLNLDEGVTVNGILVRIKNNLEI